MALDRRRRLVLCAYYFTFPTRYMGGGNAPRPRLRISMRLELVEEGCVCGARRSGRLLTWASLRSLIGIPIVEVMMKLCYVYA